MGKVVYQQSRLPAFSSDFTQKFAKELWEYVLYCKEARKPREKFIRECDEAYLCHRYVPDTGAIQLIEDGEFGETDIFDNTNVLSIRLALATMPRNEPWLTVSSREDEADNIVQAIQDHQIFMHKKAKTRRNMQRVWKQAIVRGRTGVHWEWHEEIVWRRLEDAANSKELRNFLRKQGMTKKQSQQFTQGRYPHATHSGPIITPVDYYDLWVDPMADLVNNRRPAKIVRRFFTLERLRAEVDELTDRDIYELPEDFKPTEVEDLYNREDQVGGRTASQRIFGTLPNHGYTSHGVKLVPVYIVYVPQYTFVYEGKKHHFYDTYFHLAIDADEKPIICRMEENPSDLGHSQILIDDWIDWFTPTASGGISGVEKLLSKYNQKNFLQLLTVTAAAHGIFPAQLMRGNAIRDGAEVSFLPGAIIETDPSIPTLAEVMTPVPSGVERGTQLGEQILRFYADDIRASAGVDGLVTDAASRTLSKPKTATEINRDVTSGSFFLDNQAENASEMLSDLSMAIFETSQRRIQPGPEGVIEYERYLGDKILMGGMSAEEFRVRRSIQVQGINGQLNREQDMQNLLKAFEVTGLMPNDPMMAALRLQIGLKICRKLGVPIPEEMEMSAAEIVATRPDVQAAAMEQAVNNPQVMELIQGGTLGGQNIPGAA